MSKEGTNYKKASTKDVILYGASESTGFNAITGLIVSFFMFFITDVALIPVAFAGLTITVARFFDAVTDPIVGAMADKTNTKMGRFRPYILVGGILFPISAVLLFWNPNIANKEIYVMVFYLLNALGVTFLSVAVNSTRNIITKDPTQRVMLSVPASIAASIMGVGVFAGTLPFTQSFADPTVGWRVWITILATISFIAWRLFDLSIKDKDTPEVYKEFTKEKVTIKKQWNVLKENRPLQMLILASSTNEIATGFSNTVTIFFLAYVLKKIELQTTLALIGVPLAIIMAIVVGQLSKKFSKKSLFVFGTWAKLALSIVMLVFRPFDNVSLVIGLMILSLALTPLLGNTILPMMADCVDYSEWKSKSKSAGIISSIFTLFNKIGGSIPAVFVGLILAALGFIEGADMQNQAVETALVVMMFGGAIFGHICSIIAMKFYPITRKFYEQMTQDIQNRETENQ